MAADEDDDLYDEEYDFVDDDNGDEDDMSDVEQVAENSEYDSAERDGAKKDRSGSSKDDESDEEFGRTEPPTDHVVHVYEYQKFKRTIDRPFTAEDAEAFASEYNRTAKPYARFAVAGKEDAKPKKSLD